MEAERIVDGGTGIVGRVDRAFLERGKHFAAGQQRRLGAGRREGFGDHAAGHAQLEILEVFEGADRLLRMDDVGTVVNAVDVVQA